MVVTIEPGLYFIDMLLEELRAGPHAASVDWARVDAFRPYGGIRIADDVACTDGAPVHLTRAEFEIRGAGIIRPDRSLLNTNDKYQKRSAQKMLECATKQNPA